MFSLNPLRTSLRSAAATPLRVAAQQQSRGFARLTLVGRLAAAPELRTTGNGTEYVRYTVATSQKADSPTSFFRVTSFAREGPAKTFLLGLGKGTLMTVEGDASMRTYDDKDGKKQTSLSVVQRTLQVLQRRGQEGETGEGETVEGVSGENQ